MAGPDEQRIKIMDRQKNLLNGHLSFRAAPLSNVSEEEVATTGWRRGPRCVDAGLANRLYMEALGTVVAHELVRLNSKTAQIRGGLACWQRRIVTAYTEEHLADDIYIETLAKLVDLSRWYFCRAFKQSFGVPPHQYHILRRIECAKQLLMAPAP